MIVDDNNRQQHIKNKIDSIRAGLYSLEQINENESDYEFYSKLIENRINSLKDDVVSLKQYAFIKEDR